MPKEVVQYPRTDYDSATEVSVHWSKEDAQGYIQFGVTRHVWGPQPEPDPNALSFSAPVHADHSYCHECALAVDRIKELPTDHPQMIGSSGPEPAREVWGDPVTVFTDPLSRKEINNLIRVLRRARDQAFGRDE